MDDTKILVELQKLYDGQEHVTDKIDSIANDVESLNKTVRGFNGTPGLVTQVATVQHSMSVMSRDIAELKLCVDNIDRKKVTENGDSVTDKEKSKSLSKEWFFDKIEYLGLAFLVWFLLDILPRIIEHFGTP